MTNAPKDDPTDEIMCSCSGTRRSLIESLLKEGKDLDAISRYTGALTGCGGCEWEIEQFIQRFTE